MLIRACAAVLNHAFRGTGTAAIPGDEQILDAACRSGAARTA
jgi:hypothetical protein